MNTTFRAVLGIAALAAALALAGCGGSGESATASGAGAAPDTALMAADDIALAGPADLWAGVPVSGPLAPGWRAHVTSPLDDVVQEVLVREGEAVKRNQVLARFRLGAVEASAASARAALKSAASDWERQKNLLREGAVSERDVESAEAAYRAAVAQDEVLSSRMLDATVRAPGAGTVTTRSVDSGDRVGTGDPLFVVADTRELELEATVPGERVSLVRVGAPVTLTVPGMEGTLEGRVARINATADPATRQVKIYARVPNPGGRLAGDLFASGSVVVSRAPHTLSVPSAALRRDGDAIVVWVVGPDARAARRTVTTGLRDERQDRVQVLTGLAEGERVIVGPVEGLAAGQPVHVTGKER